MAIGSVCLVAKAPAAHLDRCSRGGGLEKRPVIILNQACSRDTGTRATSYSQRQSNLKAQRCRSSRLSGRRRWALERVLNFSAPGQEQVESKKEPGKCVLVAGATGGVGQLVVAALLERGVQVRALLRDAEKARSLFGDSFEQLKVHIGDLRQPQQLDQSLFEGVTHVICCTGTTAFPSKRWDGDNGPENTDWIGVRNLIAALPKSIRKVVLVTSVGVTKYNELPWNIMNLFGVLKYKKLSEDFLQSSGLPYTIVRPGRLTDGPYTSYDLNTLLKATAGTRRAVTIGQGDKLIGEASRLVVAECCIQALDLDITTGQVYEVNSVEGEGPGRNPVAWELLFRSAQV